jgi:hypothetical protein
MADWNFYLAYNLFRLAAITQGMPSAWSTAPRPARRPAPPARPHGPLAEMAGAFAHGLRARPHPDPTPGDHMDFSYSPRTQELQAA